MYYVHIIMNITPTPLNIIYTYITIHPSTYLKQPGGCLSIFKKQTALINNTKNTTILSFTIMLDIKTYPVLWPLPTTGLSRSLFLFQTWHQNALSPSTIPIEHATQQYKMTESELKFREIENIYGEVVERLDATTKLFNDYRNSVATEGNNHQPGKYYYWWLISNGSGLSKE